MNKNHLRLVVPKKEYSREKTNIHCIIKKIINTFFCMFTTKEEKIYILKDFLIKIYRDYEISTGYKDVPYYIKADLKLSKIIQENKVDYYYKLSKKFQNR
jgi:hypothetical protein